LKVKIRDTVGLYQVPGKLWEVYYPGDIIEVPTSEFHPEVMEKIEEPKTEEPKHTGGPSLEPVVGGVPPSVVEAEVTVTAEEPPAEPIFEEPKRKKKRRKT
jgi:hypothetical protein